MPAFSVVLLYAALLWGCHYLEGSAASPMHERPKTVELDLVLLLESQVQPQTQAKPYVDRALSHIQDPRSQGRFQLLTLHVSLAATRHKIRTSLAGPVGDRLTDDFRGLAISHWARPETLSDSDLLKLFTYIETEIAEKLARPGPREIEGIGVTLLSIACPDVEAFSTDAAKAAGAAAKAIWDAATNITATHLQRAKASQ